MLTPYFTVSPVSLAFGALACLVALGVRVYQFLHFRGLPSPPLSLWEYHNVTPQRAGVGEVYEGWFGKYGKTLALRVSPRYRPVILTADPAFCIIGKVAKDLLGLQESLAAQTGPDRRRVKRVFETTFSVANVRTYFPGILSVMYRERDILKKSESEEVMPFELVRRVMVEITQKVGLGENSDGVAKIEDALREWQTQRAKSQAAQSKRSLKNWIPKAPTWGKEETSALNVVVEASKAIGARKQEEVNSGTSNDQGYLATFCRNTGDDVKASRRMSETEVAHNIPLLFVASTDATSNSLRWMIHEVATHPAVQAKLRKELSSLGESPSLDELTGGYLDAVIEESMRRGQPYLTIDRECTKDCVVPLRYPVQRGGRTMTSVSVKKGDDVSVSLVNLNMNPDLYGQDAANFRPERWTDGSVSAEADVLSGTWGRATAFWAGGRGCPVFNYPLACARAMLFVLVRNFELSEPQGQTIKRYHGIQGTEVNGKRQFDFRIILKSLKAA